MAGSEHMSLESHKTSEKIQKKPQVSSEYLSFEASTKHLASNLEAYKWWKSLKINENSLSTLKQHCLLKLYKITISIATGINLWSAPVSQKENRELCSFSYLPRNENFHWSFWTKSLAYFPAIRSSSNILFCVSESQESLFSTRRYSKLQNELPFFQGIAAPPWRQLKRKKSILLHIGY